MTNLRALLTGAEGQVGSEIVKKSPEYYIELIPLNKRLLDITDSQAVLDCFDQHQPDIVINAAAYTAVDKAEQEKETAYKVNRDGPRYLAEACVAREIPLLHISTDFVFDGLKGKPYVEDDAPNPINVYGASKWEGEKIIQKTNPRHIILRTSWVFGLSGDNFVMTVMRLSKLDKPLRIVNDQFGSPTPASSIAEALLELCKKYSTNKNLSWGTYHFTGKSSVSWFEFAKVILSISMKLGITNECVELIPISTCDYPTTAKRPGNSILATEKFEKNFGLATKNWKGELSIILKQL